MCRAIQKLRGRAFRRTPRRLSDGYRLCEGLAQLEVLLREKGSQEVLRRLLKGGVGIPVTQFGARWLRSRELAEICVQMEGLEDREGGLRGGSDSTATASQLWSWLHGILDGCASTGQGVVIATGRQSANGSDRQ